MLRNRHHILHTAIVICIYRRSYIGSCCVKTQSHRCCNIVIASVSQCDCSWCLRMTDLACDVKSFNTKDAFCLFSFQQRHLFCIDVKVMQSAPCWKLCNLTAFVNPLPPLTPLLCPRKSTTTCVRQILVADVLQEAALMCTYNANWQTGTA